MQWVGWLAFVYAGVDVRMVDGVASLSPIASKAMPSVVPVLRLR